MIKLIESSVADKNGILIIIKMYVEWKPRFFFNDRLNDVIDSIEKSLICVLREYEFIELIRKGDLVSSEILKDAKKTLKKLNIDLKTVEIKYVRDSVYSNDAVNEYRKGIVEGLVLRGIADSTGNNLDQLAEVIANKMMEKEAVNE